MSLIALQREFRAHILHGTDAIEQRVPDRALRGLRVYRHAYHATLVDCLRDTYEKTAAWLGDDAFEAAADTYIDTYPPSSWTLADYGRQFPAALALAYPDDPEVGELAWLDLALRQAFAAGDLPGVDPAALADVDWDRATIHFAPHVAVRATRTNVVALWNALAGDATPPDCDTDIPGGLLVWRDGLSPYFRSTMRIEAETLIALTSGISFANACALVGNTHDLGPDDVGEMLCEWLSSGLIIAIA